MNKRNLNEARIAALAGKIGDKQLAKIIGCNKETVLKRRQKLGIPGSLRKYDWPKIFYLAQSGVPVRTIAKQMGKLSESERVIIYRKLKKEGIAYPKQQRRIPRPTRTQLNMLVEFYDLPRRDLVKLIGVGATTIKQWRKDYNLAELRATGETAG